MSAIIPISKIPITVRPATLADLPAIDGLQKIYHKQLGFFPRAQIEDYIAGGWMIVAEDVQTQQVAGYCASRDRYLKRDELGAIFQLCVAPGNQRKFVGMTLLKYIFDHAPYGCKLYCCWCAQDIEANWFWESMGFVPLAFRAGSAKKSRVHIFWQRRIREGDATTPYWFPAQTNGGSIRHDRIVLPIPPGTHWSDAKPLILPGDELPEEAKLRADSKKRRERTLPAAGNSQPTPCGHVPTLPGLQFTMSAPAVPAKKKRRQKNKPAKTDPRLVSAARELRDRWLERVNEDPSILSAQGGQGKYELARRIASEQSNLAPNLPPNLPSNLAGLPAIAA